MVSKQMTDSLFPWQTEQWSLIARQFHQNALPHALLFTGMAGVGKLHFAELLVAGLLCENPDHLKACGECKQCKLQLAGTHTDYRLTEPKDDSVVIKIDAIRELVGFFNQSGLQGGLQITIVNPADALNINAANALLKTLEEPTRNSLIILICQNPGKLLPTIRSRCQVLNFDLPSPELAQQWLSDSLSKEADLSYDSADLEALLKLSSGAPLQAKEYALLNALDENNKMLDELAALLKNDVLASDISARWDDDLSKQRLAWTLKWLALILTVKMTGNASEINGQHGDKMLCYLANRCSEAQILALYQNSLAQFRLLCGNSNPNKGLVFESLLYQWADLMK